MARLLKGSKALLLQAHGATTGHDIEEGVRNMLQSENQAWMNYYTLSAVSSNDPAIPDALIAELSGRTPLAELPHFKVPIARASGQPRVGGVWQYYTTEVSKDF